MARIVVMVITLTIMSLHVTHVLAQTQVANQAAILPPVYSLLLEGESVEATVVNALITPSRTQCASPCTVVFSADKTTAQGLDTHGVWSQLSYYWDFDTDESDTYGSLYNQMYTYVEGDTSFEKGHVPMATKTFLCETGTCVYNVGMRAQNVAGEHDDDFVEITVNAESTQWNATNTVCISNTLNTSADWTGFDKACPAGATKRSTTLFADEYDGKLILLKKGDVFEQNIATYPNQSNWKMGVFGDHNESRPEIDGKVILGVTTIPNPTNAPWAANYNNITRAEIQGYGWPSNIYLEGLKLASFDFPMSHNHVGIHDIDMDRGSYTSGGRIVLSNGRDRCFGGGYCDLVPFAKGAYISSVSVVGFDGGDRSVGLNVSAIGCDMSNFTGIVDGSFYRTTEHNLRTMGYYRYNIQRNLFRGGHYFPGKAKVTTRACNANEIGPQAYDQLGFANIAGMPATWADDIMNSDGSMKMRTEAATTAPFTNRYSHQSRYLVVNGNQLGDATAPIEDNFGGPKYINNGQAGAYSLHSDIILTNNLFERDQGATESGGDLQLEAFNSTCVDNQYTNANGCYTRSNPVVDPNISINPQPIPAPESP